MSSVESSFSFPAGADFQTERGFDTGEVDISVVAAAMSIVYGLRSSFGLFLK